MQGNIRKWLWIGAGFLAAWLGIQYLLPLLFPFGIGLALALAAEPAVKAGSRYLKLPRWAAAGFSVTLTLIAGLIPSRVAAKKDPVEALRTE